MPRPSFIRVYCLEAHTASRIEISILETLVATRERLLPMTHGDDMREVLSIVRVTRRFTQADEQPVLLKAMPGQDERENYPSVAILIPTYNEEREILEPVVKAAYELDWPEGKVGVYVCDDGGRDWVKSGCPLRGAAAARSSRRSMASVTCVLCALWVPWGLRSEERGTFT